MSDEDLKLVHVIARMFRRDIHADGVALTTNSTISARVPAMGFGAEGSRGPKGRHLGT